MRSGRSENKKNPEAKQCQYDPINVLFSTIINDYINNLNSF